MTATAAGVCRAYRPLAEMGAAVQGRSADPWSYQVSASSLTFGSAWTLPFLVQARQRATPADVEALPVP